MADAQFRFEQDVRNVGLIKGVYIEIIKTEIKPKHVSSVKIGTSKKGHIKEDLELDRPLYFNERDNEWLTSCINNVFIKENKTYIETETSIYEVNFL
jgi:hypothetical protein